jgi:hypothetical protein
VLQALHHKEDEDHQDDENDLVHQPEYVDIK